MIPLALVQQPTSNMRSTRVSMGPVDNTPALTPFVFPEKLDRITLSKRVYSRSKIDVMGDQECLPGRQLENKFLMPAALIIIGQQFDDHPLTRHLQIVLMVCKCLGDKGI